MESDESQVQLELQRIAEIKDSLERFIPELSTLYSADVIRWTFAMCTGFCLRQAVDENPDWRAPAQAHVERLRAVVNGKLNMSPKRSASCCRFSRIGEVSWRDTRQGERVVPSRWRAASGTSAWPNPHTYDFARIHKLDGKLRRGAETSAVGERLGAR
jgi:hypothetical protein